MKRMKLVNLLDGVEYALIQGDLNIDINSIEYDSRKVTAGALFACEVGYTQDGHIYAKSAIEKGAKALVVEYLPEGISQEITVIKVPHTPSILSKLANNFTGEAWRNMFMVGVTGTNGKTTITNLIEDILVAHHKKMGVIGTIENRIDGEVRPTNNTTPMPFDLQKILKEMEQCKVDIVAMEVSSHALALGRVKGMHFNYGIFTNLTLDHLDYHETMENYLEAKAVLFKMCDVGIFNSDDPHVGGMMKEATCRPVTYGIDKEAEFKAKDVRITAEGVGYTLLHESHEIPVFVPIPGKFSVYNSLAVIAVSHLLGVSWNTILTTLKAIPGVRGRFQSIRSSKGYTAIVDYAHSPDGLRNVLETIGEFVEGNTITVFGCGGDRDNSKRPVMGKIAGTYSDVCIVTSDNPRTEEPNSILDQIELGVKETGCEYVKIVDRREAIHYALSIANKGDVILIAGKGHEDYQILGKTKVHFDDVEIVEEYMKVQE